MVMDGSSIISWTFHNNCDVLSGGNLPHKSHILPTECPCIHKPDYSLHNTTERMLTHVH